MTNDDSLQNVIIAPLTPEEFKHIWTRKIPPLLDEPDLLNSERALQAALWSILQPYHVRGVFVFVEPHVLIPEYGKKMPDLLICHRISNPPGTGAKARHQNRTYLVDWVVELKIENGANAINPEWDYKKLQGVAKALETPEVFDSDFAKITDCKPGAKVKARLHAGTKLVSASVSGREVQASRAGLLHDGGKSNPYPELAGELFWVASAYFDGTGKTVAFFRNLGECIKDSGSGNI